MGKFLKTNIQKKTQKRDLSQFDVFIDDNSRLSPEFFNITQLDDEFSIGKNAFLIRGTEKLRSGSGILVEVTDVNGDVIFSRTHDYKESNARVVSVFVYENTPTGPAYINVMGEAETDRERRPVPNRWQNKYNVRWSRKVNVNPNVYNINRVRFIRRPSITVEKLTLPDLELGYIIEGDRNLTYDSTVTTPTIGLKGRINLNASGAQESVVRINTGSQCGGFFPFFRGMEGFNLQLRDLSQFNLISPVQTDINTLDFEINQVVNNSTLRVTPTEETDQFSQTFELSCYDDFEIDFVRADPDTVVSQGTSTCYVQLQLNDIRTFAGTVLRAAVYARDFQTDDSFTFVGDFELPPEELMIDLNTNNTPKTKRTGVFLDQSDVNNFLEPLNSYSVLQRNNDTLLNSVNVKRNKNANVVNNINNSEIGDSYGGASISGNPSFYVNSLNSNPSGFTINDNDEDIIGLKFPFLEKNGVVNLKSDTRYALSFRYLLENFDKSDNNSEFGVFIRYKTRDDQGNLLEIEERLKNVKIRNNIHELGEVNINFEPERESLSGDGNDLQLVIKIESGNWYFSNFSLVPLQRPGFSPDFTTLFFPLERSILQDLGDKIEFKVDLFDLDRNKIPIQLLSNSGIDITDCVTSPRDTSPIEDSFSGTAIFSGDNDGDSVKTEFKIAHGLGETPDSWTVTPITDDASALSHTIADSTHITVIYDTAPPTGTDNLEFRYTIFN